MILALLTALALCAEPVPEALPELPSEPPAFRLPKPSPIPPSERGMDMTMEFSAREIRRWHRGRKVGISGIFLGMAGVGLAAGGFTLAVGGRGEGPLTERQLLVTTGAVGAGMAGLGVGLQIGGGRMQQSALPPHDRRLKRTRAIAIAAGAVGLAGSAIVAWRLLDDRPDGLWLPVAAPLAVSGVIVTSGLHTLALLDADVQLEEALVRLVLMPNGVGIRGRF
mgnify:CR=1 FL=1